MELVIGVLALIGLVGFLTLTLMPLKSEKIIKPPTQRGSVGRNVK